MSTTATSAASSFLADALDDLSNPVGGTGVNAAPVNPAVLNAATGAIADTLSSSFSNAAAEDDASLSEAAKKDAAKNMAKLSKAAGGLALASLRGVKPGEPPVKLQAGGLSLTASRANSASMFSVDNSTDLTTNYDDDLAEFVLPTLPPIPGMGNGPIDASMLVWDQSPWVYEAGAIGSNVAGLTLSFPDQKNKEAKVDLGEGGAEISIKISRVGSPAQNILQKDTCIYLDETKVTSGGARFWSDRGCRVDTAETNATHIVCKCTHLTDFGSRLFKSLASSADVLGQLSGSEEELMTKATANLVTIFVMVGILVLTCFLCAVGTWMESCRRHTAKKLALLLTHKEKYTKYTQLGNQKITIQNLESSLFKEAMASAMVTEVDCEVDVSCNNAVRHKSVEEKKRIQEESQNHVVDSMCRFFLQTTPIYNLRASLKKYNKSQSRKSISRTNSQISMNEEVCSQNGTRTKTKKMKQPDFNHAVCITDEQKDKGDDHHDHDEETIGTCQSFCATIFNRAIRQWKRLMAVQHEWVSPFALTADTAHFTPAMRIILLVFVLLSQILMEALLYDLYNPDQAGTCALVNIQTSRRNITNTTNFTTSVVYIDGVLQNDTSLLYLVETVEPTKEAVESTKIEKQGVGKRGIGKKIFSAVQSSGSFNVTDLFKPPRPPAPLLEDLLVALTTAIMVVPLASICVSALMKIAVGNQHSAMWERYAVTDLQKENLHAIHEVVKRRKENNNNPWETFLIGLISCGGTAFLFRGKPSHDFQDNQDTVPKDATVFTLTCKTAAMIQIVEITSESKGKEEHKEANKEEDNVTAIVQDIPNINIRVFDPIQGEVIVPCKDLFSAKSLCNELRFIICHLPTNEASTGAAICSALGRHNFVSSFHTKYGGAERKKKKNCCSNCFSCFFSSKEWQPNYNIRNQNDRNTCQRLENVCEKLVFHAEEQERLLSEITEWQEEKNNREARLDEEEKQKAMEALLDREDRINESCCRRLCCGSICVSILDFLCLAEICDWLLHCLFERKNLEEEKEEEEEMHEFTHEQVDSFFEVFETFDMDGSGHIELDELAGIMRAMGATPSTQDIKKMMERFDADKSGTLDFKEVLIMLNTPLTDNDGEALNVFRSKNIAEEIRNQLVPEYQIACEQEEDEARKHIGGCLCQKMFDAYVANDRSELTDAHRSSKKWLIYGLMSTYMGMMTFYIILFGFCHGQPTTLDWLWGLLSQTLLSCFFVRPVQVFVLNGVLPAIFIEVGLAASHKSKISGLQKARERRSIELSDRENKEDDLVKLNDMLNNPMSIQERTKSEHHEIPSIEVELVEWQSHGETGKESHNDNRRSTTTSITIDRDDAGNNTGHVDCGYV